MYTGSTARGASALLACATVSLALLPSAAHAQTFFPNNTTLNSSNPVTGDAVIGYANQTDLYSGTNSTSPTVSL